MVVGECSQATITLQGLTPAYEVDRCQLTERLEAAFFELRARESTQAFVTTCFQQPQSWASEFLFSTLRRFVNDYDANGRLGTHRLHLLGADGWSEFLANVDRTDSLLDIGAGDGHVTLNLAPYFKSVSTIESSAGMAKRLRLHGFDCLEGDLSGDLVVDEQFDVVAMLNVIDRTHRPFTLLERARDRLNPGGRLVLSVPLPLRPHAYVGKQVVTPEEKLPAGEQESFERAVNDLVDLCFVPLGLQVVSWTRAPYLSAGNAAHPVHRLDAGIFCLSAV